MKFNIIEEADMMLVPLELKHAQNILEANYDNVKKYFIPFDSIEEAKNWIQETEITIEQGNKVEVVIFYDSSFSGMLAIDNLLEEQADIRLWIQPDQQQKGIAKKAFILLMNWFKANYPNKVLIYTAEVDNIPSIKFAESLGFVFVREFVDSDGIESLEYKLEFRE